MGGAINSETRVRVEDLGKVISADEFGIVELSFLISDSNFIKHHHAWNEEKVCKFIEPDCYVFS